MDYCLDSGVFGNVFAVPKAVVENYIKLANEASIKVLLFILCNNGKEYNGSSIAAALNISENQVEEAFVFWENANILQNRSKSGNSPAAPDERKVSAEEKPVEKKAEKKLVRDDRRDYNLNPSEIAERVEKSQYIKGMFTMSEQTFGRPLTHSEQRSFIWMYDYLGLNTEVILMITAYCVSMEKGGIKYIETVAADWSERGINTLELAQKEIEILEEKSSYMGKVMKILGADHKPTAKQKKTIDKWREQGYDLGLIECAYEKTIDSINKLNLSYMNKILENWHTEGILTKSQVEAVKSNTNTVGVKKEYSFNLDDYKSLINDFGD